MLLIAILTILGVIIAGCALFGASTVDECEKLTDGDKDSCYVKYASERKDIELCENINTRANNLCLKSVAEAMGDPNLCAKIVNDTYWSDICYKDFAEQIGSVELCEKIEHPGDKDDCFAKVALDTEDGAICERISDLGKVDACKYTLATESGNLYLCQELRGLLNRDVCRMKVALKTGNREICDFIGIGDLKRECNARFDAMADSSSGPSSSSSSSA